jgi:hypothetical protein
MGQFRVCAGKRLVPGTSEPNTYPQRAPNLRLAAMRRDVFTILVLPAVVDMGGYLDFLVSKANACNRYL